MPSDPPVDCPRCGTTAPEVRTLGLCPTCLLEAGKTTASGETADSQIGIYTLHGKLGEGAFGTVYLAEQRVPVERDVALKVLKAGAASPEASKRFEAERQTLARLDHPNIATFLDADETPEGLPYFVMELVDGEPVTDFCDREKLTIRQRLGLFLDICGALQHAHQKGVIHRDLKPQNILVGKSDDGTPVPKIIDFGVAKLLEPITAGSPGTTVATSILGTPAYMSPEQAGGRTEDIDTRTDVYALGVILYELLSGQLPFDPERLQKAAYVELENILANEDPPPPSTRVGETASLRATTSAKLGSQMRGDLDWIVARAMEKNADRRYSGVSAFASDIRRHLDGETVEAGPPDLRYRAGKFVRKHRAPIFSALLLLAAVIAGATISIFQALRATRAEAKALDEAARAGAAVDFLLKDILGQADPENSTDRDLTLKDAIDRGASLIDTRFAGRPKIASFLHTTLSSAYINLGDRETAIRESKRAISLTRPTKDTDAASYFSSLFSLGSIYLMESDLTEARALFEDEIAPFTQSPDSALRSDALELHGKLLLEELRYGEAETTLLAALESASSDLKKASILGILGTVYTFTGRHKESIDVGERALALAKKGREPDSINVLRAEQSLARAYGNAGLHDDAIARFKDLTARSIKTLGPDHPEVDSMQNTLAYTLDETGRSEEAEVLLRQIIARGEAAGTYSFQQLIALDNLAFILSSRQDYQGAATYNLTSIREKKKRFGETAPQVLNTELNHAVDLRDSGNAAAAERDFRRIYQAFADSTTRSNQNTLRAAHSLAITLSLQDRQREIADFLLPALSGLGILQGDAASKFIECESYLLLALQATGDTARLQEYYFDRLWQDPHDPSPWFRAHLSPAATAIGFAALGKSAGRIPRDLLGRLPAPLIPPGATWHYYDDPEAPPKNWHAPSFDSSSWKSGPSELGYGDGDEATTLSYGDDPADKPITSYFRTTFEIATNSPLALLLSCDDGAVAYIDSKEIGRIHLPIIEITPDTRAILSVGQTLETDFVVLPIPSVLLTPGTHTIAIEIHQDRPSSSDITCLPVLLPTPAIPADTSAESDGLPDNLSSLLEIHRLIAVGDKKSAHENLRKLISTYPGNKSLIAIDESLTSGAE